jgi:hypothetical protein
MRTLFRGEVWRFPRGLRTEIGPFLANLLREWWLSRKVDELVCGFA